MRMLLYKDLDIRRVKPAFAKVRAAIEAGDFRSADVKKLAPTAYWRARQTVSVPQRANCSSSRLV